MSTSPLHTTIHFLNIVARDAITSPTAALLLALAASDVPAPGCASFDLSLAGIGSLEEDPARTAGLAGSGPVWPGVLRRPSGARPLLLCPDGAPLREEVPDPAPAAQLSFELVPPASLTRVLSGWADDRNDGALWAGRGLSASLTAGVRARWKWFSAQLAPLAAWQMNSPFYVPPASFPGLPPWANPFNYGAIDLPLRTGGQKARASTGRGRKDFPPEDVRAWACRVASGCSQ